MELDSRVFVDVLGPLAAFSGQSGDPGPDPDLGWDGIPDHHRDGVATDWVVSPLNPQSRIDSLRPCAESLWRVDGADVDGRRFFAVPTFALGAAPLRIDVYLPPIEEYPRRVREVLQPEALLYVDPKRIHSLPITVHITRALNYWAASQADFERQYRTMPFGSQILITDVAASIQETASSICLCPSYDVEQAMLSVAALQAMWHLPADAWPPAIPLSDLGLIKQLHEAITLVTTPNSDQETVFKSLLRDQRYLYNELRMLLSLPPHENLIPRPIYVVTHRGRFGGKVGVVGFILRYYPRGSLKGYLLRQSESRSHQSQSQSGPEYKSRPRAGTSCQSRFGYHSGSDPEVQISSQYESRLPPAHLARLSLSLQIASALHHINTAHPTAGFYPDLKPDNIVLSHSPSGHLTPILLDLEQRGGWYAWSPPEVGYVEYLEVIARAATLGEITLLEEEEQELTRLLAAYLPGFFTTPPSPTSREERYQPVHGGFSPIWRELLRRRVETNSPELEKAQVFLLGKLLWCIWEGEAMVRCGIDYELLQDRGDATCISGRGRGKRFPEFGDCPVVLRGIITRCTRGAREWDSSPGKKRLAVRAGRLAVRAGRLVVLDGEGNVTGEDARLMAKGWWAGEIARAKEFLRGGKVRVEMEEWVAQRPSLEEVIEELRRAGACYDSEMN